MKKVLIAAAMIGFSATALAQTSSSTSSAGSSSGAIAGAQSGVVGVTTSSGNQQSAQQVGQNITFNSTGATELKTVGNPGAVSYGVSFSQYNCANTAAAGGGGMGIVLQLGGPLESGPCNARANANALFQLSAALRAADAVQADKLFNAAVLLIGNSTEDTRKALSTAGVKGWTYEPEKVSQPAQTANCSKSYCGNDPVVKARLGIQ